VAALAAHGGKIRRSSAALGWGLGTSQPHTTAVEHCNQLQITLAPLCSVLAVWVPSNSSSAPCWTRSVPAVQPLCSAESNPADDKPIESWGVWHGLTPAAPMRPVFMNQWRSRPTHQPALRLRSSCYARSSSTVGPAVTDRVARAHHTRKGVRLNYSESNYYSTSIRTKISRRRRSLAGSWV